MSPRHLLAIDVGTQSARALVFDAAGHPLAKAQEFLDPPYRSIQPAWAEQEVEVYWRALTAACRRLWAGGEVRPDSIAGLALTTLRGSVVCADTHGRALRPAILWLDQRRCSAPPPLGPWWNALFAAVGARDLIRHFQAEAEANWLAQHEPELWRATEKFVLLSGYLTHRLCGAWVDSAGCQVGYLPFDYRRQDWAAPRDFRWRALAVRREQLPRLLPPGAKLGSLCTPAAQELGLPPGLGVYAAAADKACEVLGSGALAADVAQLSFGTTATINTTQARYVEVQPRLPAYPAALPGHWNTEIQIYRGFWMVSWFKREFAHREQQLAAERGVPAETLFDDLLASVPPGAQGLILQPYWSPGVREPGPEAKGAIIGFGEAHTRAHVYRAIIEGLAYGLRAGKEQIERRLRRKLARVIVSGGGSQSDAAMQITADVFGQVVERPQVYESAALGAAIDLAVGLGLYPDFPAAMAAMTRRGRVFQPRPEAARLYEALYREVYRKLYPRLQPLYRRIRAITGYPP
jgi:sugar (pentulose or hexulose) kinase